MRLVKMLGPATIAVMALMATVQAGTATAVTLLEEVVWCAERVHKCPSNKYFHAGNEIFSSATNTVFLLNLVNVTCGASEIHMTNTGLLVHGNVTALVFGECKEEGGGECTVEAKNLEYLFTGTLSSNHLLYEIKVKEKPSNGIPRISFKCAMGLDCTYSATQVSIIAQLAFTPERLSVLQSFTAEGVFCIATAMVWHATYDTTKCRANEGAELKNCWVKMENWAL